MTSWPLSLARAALACVVTLLLVSVVSAAPRITNLSLRGLQAGGVNTLIIDGSDLLPDPRLVFSLPVAKLTIKDGATANRLEAEITLDGRTPPGIYTLRACSASGITEPVALGVDNLPQLPFAPQLATTNVALTGAISGSAVLSTVFTGKKDQRVVIEVESRRLGANLNPVVHLYDARRKQIAWSQGLPVIANDARLATTLPADGAYTIEVHDALYRGADPGFLRLKVGDLHYANLAYPLAVQQGTNATFQFAATDLPADAKASATWTRPGGLPVEFQPAPWPADVTLLSGSRPAVMVTQQPEVLEAPPAEKPQEVPAAPVAINGRIEKPGEHDRFRLVVTPGQQLRFDVLARRAGSTLDGVLSIQNEAGAELAGNDDRPGTSDPGLDFKVPDGANALLVAIRDLEGRGGADFVYRISVQALGAPDFSLSLAEDRFLVPKDGVALARVRVERNGYGGPIKLDVANLPASLSITGDEIPAGATQALVTLSAPGLNPAQSVAALSGSNTEGTTLRRPVSTPRNNVTTHQPWLANEVAVAITPASPLAVSWDLFASDTRLAQGTALPIKVRVQRAAGTAGAVRLNLLTTQVAPRKKVKVNNQDREVDDVERTIRFEAAPTISADQGEVDAKLLVPADLPQIAYDLAIEAELLGPDNKAVVTSALTPARRMLATVPIALELASTAPVEARAGLGPTGSLTGKVKRASGFASPVTLTLAGLPKGVTAPSLLVAGEKSDFEFPLTFPYGTPPGDLANVKLVGTSQINPKDPKLVIRANEVAVAVKVVPGEKPPQEKPFAIFEDQSEFPTYLDQGGGQASLFADEKYSGGASVKVTPDQKFNPALPGLSLKIREKPGAGEFRFLRFAWKKQGGQAICLQLNHDGQWGPSDGKPAPFRYHAGPGGECYGASVAIDANLPTGFTVVTRDLFADFGEFTLNGLALSPVDGEFALYDHIYLGTTAEDFESVKPAP